MVNKLLVSFPCPYKFGCANVMPVQTIAGISVTRQFRFQSPKAARLSALVELPAMAGIVIPVESHLPGFSFASESPGLCKSQAG